MAKRYYWLKLRDDFFRQLPMKKLRRIAGGDTYTIIYLKMMLITTKTDGMLGYDGAADDFIANLALDIDEDEQNVEIAVQFLLANKLMVELEDGKMLLPEAKEAVGSESASTIRSRECRARQKALQCNTSATLLQQVCSVEKEIEIEIEKDNAAVVVNTEYISNSCSSNSKKEYNPIDDLQYKLGFLPTAYQAEQFIDLCNDVGAAVFEKALVKAAKAGVKNFNYIKKTAYGLAAGDDFDDQKRENTGVIDWDNVREMIKD